jgi:hypothetical protein
VADYLVLLSDGSVQMAGEVDDLLGRHRVLTGPAAEVDQLTQRLGVVHAWRAEAQAHLLVRTNGSTEPIPPGWETHPVSLEELALAYLREPWAATLPGSAPPGRQIIGGDEMTTLTVPARQEHQSTGSVPWRRMAWVIWRQHRVALAGLAAFLGTLALYVWVVGLQLHHAYIAATTCNPNSPTCADLIAHFNNMNHVLQGGYILQAAPLATPPSI